MEGTARASKAKLTGVTGEGVRCIAESLESLRTSWGVGGEEIAGVDAKLEERECSASDDSRVGPAIELELELELDFGTGSCTAELAVAELLSRWV